MKGRSRWFNEKSARKFGGVIKDLVDKPYKAAKVILERRSGELEKLAAVLLETETFTADQLPAPIAVPAAAE